MAAMCFFFIIGPLRMICALVVDETESDRMGQRVTEWELLSVELRPLRVGKAGE